VFGRFTKKLEETIRAHDVAQLEILLNQKFSREIRLAGLRAAIATGWAEGVDALLARRDSNNNFGFDLSSEGGGDMRLARDLLESADIGNRDLWRVLWTWQTGASGCGRLRIEDLFSIIKEKAPHDALATFIDITDPSNTEAFDELVYDFGRNSPDDLRRILEKEPCLSRGRLVDALCAADELPDTPDIVARLFAMGLVIDSAPVADRLIACVCKSDSPMLAAHIVKTTSDYQSYVFEQLVYRWGARSLANMRTLMKLVASNTDLRQALNGAFIKAIETKASPDILGVMLDAGADPEYPHGEALFQAAMGNAAGTVDLLLPRMDLAVYGQDLLLRLRPYAQNIDPALFSRIEAAVWEAAPDSGATQYARVDDVTLSEVKNLPHGLRLTTVFNFERREETQIVQKTEGDAALAVSARSFSALDDVQDLEGLRQKLIDLKGNPPSLNAMRHKDRIKVIPT